MNKELLDKAIVFFEKQGGTYDAMRTQMLAGGFSEIDIAETYSEIQRMGLDKANPIPKIASVNVAEPGTFVAPSVQSSSVLHIAPSKGMQTVMFAIVGLLFVVTGGAFAYAKWQPQSSIGMFINTSFGMTPVAPINSQPVKTPEVAVGFTSDATTTPNLVTGTSTEQASLNKSTTTMVVAKATTTATVIPTKKQSEIDKYGVDLFTLKEGTTTKIISSSLGETVTYVKNNDSVFRKYEKKNKNESTSSSATISLIAKAYLEDMISKIETECKPTNFTSTDCTKIKKAYDHLVTNCRPLVKNEEISSCISLIAYMVLDAASSTPTQ